MTDKNVCCTSPSLSSICGCHRPAHVQCVRKKKLADIEKHLHWIKQFQLAEIVRSPTGLSLIEWPPGQLRPLDVPPFNLNRLLRARVARVGLPIIFCLSRGDHRSTFGRIASSEWTWIRRNLNWYSSLFLLPSPGENLYLSWGGKGNLPSWHPMSALPVCQWMEEFSLCFPG